MVASSSVETASRRFVFVGDSFSGLLRTHVCRLNNILINYRSLCDTDIRQCRPIIITPILFIVLIAI